MWPRTVSIPNGANRLGIFGSLKALFLCTLMNLPSQTSTLPWLMLGAYRRGPLDVFAIARPVRVAPRTRASFCADVSGGTSWLQAVIRPVIEENRKFAGPFFPPDLTTKDFESLNTVPVGTPPGILTVSGTFVTGFPAVSPEYSVETPVPSSAIHPGVAGLVPNDRPQAFTRSVSRTAALPAWSETRLWVL